MPIKTTIGPSSSAKVENKAGFPTVDKLLSYLILLLGAMTVGLGASHILTSHSFVPFWDEWTEIDTLATAPNHHVPLSWLWAQHNEHRVVFYRVLLLADIHLFHGKHWISFWSMLVVQLLSLMCLAWMLRLCGIVGTLWRAIVGLGGFALFSPAQWENFRWAFQISFLLPGFFLLLALSALLKYQQSVEEFRPQWGYLALSITAAAASTYSNANGMLLWPVLFLVAMLTLPRIEVLGCYAGFGAVFVGLYLYHYAGATGPSSPLHALGHPLAIGAYMAEYFGVTHTLWGVRIGDWFAVSSGLVGLVVALVIVVIALRTPKREPLQISLLGITCFVIATALLTALGRMSLGLEQSFSSRYQTFNLLFWFSIVSLLLLLADKVRPSMRTVLLAGTAGAMLFAFATFPIALGSSSTRTQRSEAAATTLLTGIPDQDAMAVLYDQPAVVWRDANYFRQQHLFMFSDAHNNELGQEFLSTYQSSPALRCEGAVTNLQRLSPEELLGQSDGSAFGITGFITGGSSQAHNHRFVFVSEQKIVGYGASLGGFLAKPNNILFVRSGSSGVQRSEIAATADSDKWIGFVQGLRNARSIDVYMLGGGPDEACHLATVTISQ